MSCRAQVVFWITQASTHSGALRQQLVAYRVVCSIKSPSFREETPRNASEAQATEPRCHWFWSLTILCGFQKQLGWDAEESNNTPRGIDTWKSFLGTKQQTTSSTSLPVQYPASEFPFLRIPVRRHGDLETVFHIFFCVLRDTFTLGEHFTHSASG